MDRAILEGYVWIEPLQKELRERRGLEEDTDTIKQKASGLDFSLSRAPGKFIWPLGRINFKIPSPRVCQCCLPAQSTAGHPSSPEQPRLSASLALRQRRA